MIIKITLNQDHLRLIEAICFNRLEIENDKIVYSPEILSHKKKSLWKNLFKKEENNIVPHYEWGIDQYGMFGGTFVMEDIARLIGKFDQFIPDTEFDADGKKYPPELTKYMADLYEYIYQNLEYIESLVHFYCTKGGLMPGTYKCKDYEKNWTREK